MSREIKAERVKSIREAFSMQPAVIEVVSEEAYDSYYDKESAIKEIKLEQLAIGDNAATSIVGLYYVGYNYDGRKLFQYLAEAVNVHFF